MTLNKLYTRLFAPEPGDTGGSGAADRGDDFVPTGDGEEGEGEEAQAALAAAEAAKKAAAKDDSDDIDPENPDGEAEPAKKEPKKDSRIPLNRHKEILAKEREQREALEAKLAKYEQGGRVAATNDRIDAAEGQLLTLEKEYAKLLTDGEHAQAAAKMTEIRRIERAVGDLKLEMAAAASQARAIEQVRYDTTVERLEAAYPQINPDHDDFDQGVAGEVRELAQAYHGMGHAPALALQKAVKALLGAEGRQQTTATEVKARVDADDVAAKLREERRKAQVQKNVAAAGKQPPATNRAGADHDAAGGSITGKDVMKMPLETFSKLDEETLARMRGDTL